ncbi:MAG: hypothetical protein AB7N76_12200 [Planctomycetota bacterium]
MQRMLRLVSIVVLTSLLAACGGGGRGRGGGGGGGGQGKEHPAAEADWKLLGEREVDFKADRDVIPVTGARGAWTKLQLRVKKRGIELLDLKVHFENGGVEDVPVREKIAAGGETRVIDLRGGDRQIEKVTLVYKSHGPGKGKSHVRVWGRR